MPFPAKLKRTVANLSHVPILSAVLPVDPACSYASIRHFAKFGDTIKFVGGINKPKLIEVGG
jgi:hypothetical protein